MQVHIDFSHVTEVLLSPKCWFLSKKIFTTILASPYRFPWLTEVVFSKFFVKNISSIQCTKQSVQMSHKKQKIPPMFLWSKQAHISYALAGRNFIVIKLYLSSILVSCCHNHCYIGTVNIFLQYEGRYSPTNYYSYV